MHPILPNMPGHSIFDSCLNSMNAGGPGISPRGAVLTFATYLMWLLVVGVHIWWSSVTKGDLWLNPNPTCALFFTTLVLGCDQGSWGRDLRPPHFGGRGGFSSDREDKPTVVIRRSVFLDSQPLPQCTIIRC